MSAKAIDNADCNYGSHLWQLVSADLKKCYGQNLYNSWFIKINFQEFLGSNVILRAPTNFIRDWVLCNYYHNIIKSFKNYDSNISVIEIITAKNIEFASEVKTNLTVIGQDDVNFDDLSSYSDARYTFDNFIVDSSNRLAYTAAISIAQASEAIKSYNPLFIYGGVGLGKTHLMQAIAAYSKANNPARKVLYISAEKFMYQFVKALRNKDTMSFKEKLRGVDVLMIDDVQFICGKGSTQEEFFHTFNALADNNRQIILSCDRAASELDDMEDRIKSRLNQGLGADVHATTYDLRLNILKSKAMQMNIEIKDDVLEFLATKITANIRELEGALNKIIAHSSLVNCAINLTSARTIFKETISLKKIDVSIDHIQKQVAKKYALEIHDLNSNKRLKMMTRPRQIAMYLAKYLTIQSLSDIGRQFGNKNHTTVMHAVKRIELLCHNSYEFKSEIDSLARSIKN